MFLIAAAARPPNCLARLLVLNGTAVSTLYWAQSTAAVAAREWGVSPVLRLAPSASLAGYAIGVAALAAFARDLTDADALGRHALLLGAGLLLAAVAPAPAALTAVCFAIGIGCALTQRALACASGHAGAERRGLVIGGVIASGLTGIVLARAAVPPLAAALGWRSLFAADALAVIALGTASATAQRALRRRPHRETAAPLPAVSALWRVEAVLRRSALQQAAVFAAFNAGWAVFPAAMGADLLGTVATGGVSAAGAAAALGAGSLCRHDRTTAVARTGCAAVLLAALIAALIAATRPTAPAAILVAMLLLDTGTQVALVANQARAQALAATPAVRGRLAAIVTTVGFAGGALGAALGNVLLR